jgi:hypothetical protein
LSLPPLVSLGLISYSAYLWHQPIFALTRIRSLTHPSPALMLLLVLVTIVMAYVTWRFVELPFRRNAAPALPSRRSILSVSAISTVAFLCVGAYGQLTEGRMRLWMAVNPEEAQVYGMHAEATSIHGVYLDDGACQFNVPNLDGSTIDRLRACRQLHGPGVALLGDSHAVDLFNGLDALHEGAFVFGMTFASCWFDTESRNCDFDRFMSMVREEPDLFDQVFYHQAGYRFFHTPDNMTGRELFRRIPEYAPVPAGYLTVLDQRIDAGLVYLAQLAQLTNLVWIGPRIEPHIGLNYMLHGGCGHRYNLRGGQRAAFVELDRRIAAASHAAEITYVSLIEATQFDMATDFMTCDGLYWRDGDHWSIDGAELFVARLLEGDLPGRR